MFFWNKIYNFIKGYVVVSVEGFFTEKFTNLCMRNNINIFEIKRKGTSKIIFETTVKDYKKMRKYAHKTGCRIKIHKKRGVPFFLFRYRKRKWFALGIALFIMILSILTSFIWEVEISGNENIPTKVLAQELAESGLKRGMLKFNFYSQEVIYKMMIKRDDIAFMSIDINGTKAKVKIVEKVLKPRGVKKDEPCDIIASRAGVITAINVLSGEASVVVGSVVNEGDILVKGVMSFEKIPEETYLVHAMAEIKARVWYEQIEKLKKSEKISDEKIRLFAYKIAYDKIMDRINKNAEIQNEDVVYEENENYIIAKITIETIESIGEEVS
ncbi:MAG: sporulation protein YqfD [Clostridia bacterium]|nr:sporulation protein YqfD [Clostridia bacterium]